MKDSLASWSVCRSLGQEVWVRDLAGSLSCVPGLNTSLPQCLYRQIGGKPDETLGGEGGNLAMDWHPIQGGESSNTPSHFMLRKPR